MLFTCRFNLIMFPFFKRCLLTRNVCKVQYRCVSRRSSSDYGDLGVFKDKVVIHYPFSDVPVSVSLSSLQDNIRHYCGKDITPQSFDEIAKARDLVKFSNMLREELPIRFAQRLVLVNGLFERYGQHSPEVSAGLERGNAILLRAFSELIIESAVVSKNATSPRENIDCLRQTLAHQATRGCNSIPPLLSALHSLRSFSADGKPPPSGEDAALIDLLFEIYALSRISTSALSDHFAAISLEVPAGEARECGVFTDAMILTDTIKRAVTDALEVCEFHIGSKIPNVEFCSRGVIPPLVGAPAHIHYPVFEVVKNALRATVKWSEVGGSPEPLPELSTDGNLRVDILKPRSKAFTSHSGNSTSGDSTAHKAGLHSGLPSNAVLLNVRVELELLDKYGNELVFETDEVASRRSKEVASFQIRVIDRGAGVSAPRLGNVFKVFVTTNLTTARSTVSESLQDFNTSAGTSHPTRVPTSPGAGVGLSMARLYARYLSGDVTLHSEGQGLGTMATIAIPVGGDDWREGLDGEGGFDALRKLVSYQHGELPNAVDTKLK